MFHIFEQGGFIDDGDEYLHGDEEGDIYMEENGYELDITDKRYHHEIYLSDPRKCDVSKLKTVIRHPIKKK